MENAAKFTLDAFSLEKEKLLKKGWRNQEASEVAWELVREEWILLRSEDQEREFGPKSASNETLLSLLNSETPPRRVRISE